MITTGSKVLILNDQDGATSMECTVLEVYKSGRCCVALPVGGFRNFKESQLMEITEREVKTKHQQQWKFETDNFEGICIVANDVMIIRFKFECESNEFYDVLKIDSAIREKLKEPVSVESMADWCYEHWPQLTTTVSGRAVSHGWITSKVNHGSNP